MPTNNVDIQNIETSRHYVSVTGTVNGQQVAGTLRISVVAEKLGITVEALNLQISSKNLSADLSKILAIRLAAVIPASPEPTTTTS